MSEIHESSSGEDSCNYSMFAESDSDQESVQKETYEEIFLRLKALEARNTSKLFSCTDCSNSYASQQALNVHKAVHKREKDCICGKGFYNKKEFDAHGKRCKVIQFANNLKKKGKLRQSGSSKISSQELERSDSAKLKMKDSSNMVTDGLKHILRKSKLTELGVSTTSADRVPRGSLPGGSEMYRYRAQASKNSRNDFLDVSRGISKRETSCRSREISPENVGQYLWFCPRCNRSFETVDALVEHEVGCLEDFIEKNSEYRSSLFTLLFQNHWAEASKFLKRWLKKDVLLRDDLAAHTAQHFGDGWVNVLDESVDFRAQMTATIINSYADELGTALSDHLTQDADSNIVERLLTDANILMQELTLHLATNSSDLWENALHAIPNFRKKMTEALVSSFTAELTSSLRNKYERETAVETTALGSSPIVSVQPMLQSGLPSALDPNAANSLVPSAPDPNAANSLVQSSASLSNMQPLTDAEIQRLMALDPTWYTKLAIYASPPK